MNERIRHLLYILGVTANYTGFSYTVSAVELTAQDYDRLLMVTKWLYPEVASQFHTTMSCVERNIRTVAGIAWLRNPELLGRLAGCTLDRKPTASRFIAILAAYLREHSVPA